MKTIALVMIGLVLGSFLGAGAVAAAPWHFYSVRGLANTSQTYQRGYALGVMDAVAYMDQDGQTAGCMIKRARSTREVYDWSARVWRTTTSINQSAAIALILDATQGCQ